VAARYKRLRVAGEAFESAPQTQPVRVGPQATAKSGSSPPDYTFWKNHAGVTVEADKLRLQGAA
jgi:hypothetical protein